MYKGWVLILHDMMFLTGGTILFETCNRHPDLSGNAIGFVSKVDFEHDFVQLQEQWKSSTHASKRKDRPQAEDEDGDKRRRKGGKRRKREKKSHYETEEAGDMDDQEGMEDVDANMNYRQTDEIEENPQDLLAAAGLEDSDAEADKYTVTLTHTHMYI